MKIRTWNEIWSDINRVAHKTRRDNPGWSWHDCWHIGFRIVNGYWWEETRFPEKEVVSTIEAYETLRNGQCAKCSLLRRGKGCRRVAGLKAALASSATMSAYAGKTMGLSVDDDGFVRCSDFKPYVSSVLFSSAATIRSMQSHEKGYKEDAAWA
jgi:hypothetical protein